MKWITAVTIAASLVAGMAVASPADEWRTEWPKTDFSRHTVPLDEIDAGGPPKDGIPAIERPRFVPVGQATDLAPQEAVIGLAIGEDARAYPLRILHWHEIVNDVVGGVPVAVTYCPLCNLPLVFDRRIDSRVLEFGTTGKLRHSGLIMYDRQTESWWQQFTGEAVVGTLAGQRLTVLPSRLESFANFLERAPNGRVLVPNDPSARPYGLNPYEGYDRAAEAPLFRGDMPEGVPPLLRVVAVEDEAWALDLLNERGRVEADGLVISWTEGQASALDTKHVAAGRDIGNILVQRRRGDRLEDVRHHITFAFAFFAHRPTGVLHTRTGEVRGAPTR